MMRIKAGLRTGLAAPSLMDRTKMGSGIKGIVFSKGKPALRSGKAQRRPAMLPEIGDGLQQNAGDEDGPADRHQPLLSLTARRICLSAPTTLKISRREL